MGKFMWIKLCFGFSIMVFTRWYLDVHGLGPVCYTGFISGITALYFIDIVEEALEIRRLSRK